MQRTALDTFPFIHFCFNCLLLQRCTTANFMLLHSRMDLKRRLFSCSANVKFMDSVLDWNECDILWAYWVYWPVIFPYGLNRSSKSFFSMSEVGKFPTKILLSKSLGSLLLQERENRPGDGLRLLRRDITRLRGLRDSFFVCHKCFEIFGFVRY